MRMREIEMLLQFVNEISVCHLLYIPQVESKTNDGKYVSVYIKRNLKIAARAMKSVYLNLNKKKEFHDSYSVQSLSFKRILIHIELLVIHF